MSKSLSPGKASGKTAAREIPAAHYGTECECGTEHDWKSFEEVLDYAMDETNNGCCRGTAKAVLMCVRPLERGPAPQGGQDAKRVRPS